MAWPPSYRSEKLAVIDRHWRLFLSGLSYVWRTGARGAPDSTIDDFELNLAMVPRSYGVKDDAERLSGVALLAYHAT